VSIVTDLQKKSAGSSVDSTAVEPTAVEPTAVEPTAVGTGGRRTRLALLAGLLAAVVVAVGSLWGLWYLPFLCGLAAGAGTAVRGLRARTAVLAGAVAALAGWGAPLLWRTASGEAVAGTARTVAALAGLPALASPVIAVTLLIGLIQALLGIWLGRTATAALRPGH
jgi:hypothetical protein